MGCSYPRPSHPRPSALPNPYHCPGGTRHHALVSPVGTGLDASHQTVRDKDWGRVLRLIGTYSVILDEIHSIGQQEGGAVWEQIILLAPCPIM
jgi:hypothetical protein